MKTERLSDVLEAILFLIAAEAFKPKSLLTLNPVYFPLPHSKYMRISIMTQQRMLGKSRKTGKMGLHYSLYLGVLCVYCQAPYLKRRILFLNHSVKQKHLKEDNPLSTRHCAWDTKRKRANELGTTN